MAARPEILARWDGQSLKAVGWADRDAIAAFPAGTTFALRKWEAGAQAQRAFAHKLIEVAAENHPDFITADKLKGDIKKAGGFTTGERTEVDGSKVEDTKSIGKMDREELTRFTEFAKDYLATEIGLNAEEVAAEAMERIKPRGARS